MKTPLIITGCILLTALMVIFFTLLPVRDKIAKTEKKIVAVNAKLSSIRSDIRKTPAQELSSQNAEQALQAVLTAGLLEPLLNSFAMNARELVTPAAQQSGFRIDSVRELPPIPLPQPAKFSSQLYHRQVIEFAGHGSYMEIAGFVKYVEELLPMANLTSIRILGQPGIPEIHKSVVCFEWPARAPDQPAIKKGRGG